MFFFLKRKLDPLFLFHKIRLFLGKLWGLPKPKRSDFSNVPTDVIQSENKTKIFITFFLALLSHHNLRSSKFPPEFSRKNLEMVEKLGEGQFGEVQLCLAEPSLRRICEDEGCVLICEKS